MGNKSNKAAQAAKETAPEAVVNQEEAVAQEKAPEVEAEATQSEAAPEQEAKVEEVVERTTKSAKEKNTASKAAKPKYPAFLDGYVKAYPKEKVFHVTADKQVFLDKDYHFAKAHQNGLGKGEITTYNI